MAMLTAYDVSRLERSAHFDPTIGGDDTSSAKFPTPASWSA